MRTALLLTLAACAAAPGATDATDPVQPDRTGLVPAASAPLGIGLAGAPVELFGPATEPRFERVFRDLATDGFTSFFPLFVTLETPDRSEYEDHLTHFLAPELLGSSNALTCKGATDPYAAAQGQLEILFPGLVLLALQDESEPLDTAALATAMQTQASSCWSDHPGVVSTFYTYDEPALFRVVNGYLEQPRLRAENVDAAAETIRETTDLKVWMVEGPGELGLRAVGLPPDQTASLIAEFEAEVASLAPTADTFGYDVYPVPDYPLTAPGDYVASARISAPDARISSVLQGMAFGRISGGAAPGRHPTLEETRFMAIDSIVAGADEIHWYGVSSLKLDDAGDAALWDAIRETAKGLSTVEDAIMGTPVRVEVSAGATARGHDREGQTVLFVSQREAASDPVRLVLPQTPTEVEVVLGPEARIVDDAVEITLGPGRAAVLRLR